MQNKIMKKQSMEKQKGMTLISWMVVIAFVGFLFMLAIRIAPIFAEDMTIGTFMKNLEAEPFQGVVSPKNIRKSVMKKMRMNNVTAVSEKDIQIKKSQGNYLVTIEYEPRGKILGKLDFIATFKHEAIVKAK